MKAATLYDSQKYTDPKSVKALGQFSPAIPEAQQGLAYQSGCPSLPVPPAIRSNKWWSPLPRVNKVLRLVLTCSHTEPSSKDWLWRMVHVCLCFLTICPRKILHSWNAAPMLQRWFQDRRPQFRVYLYDLFSLLFPFTPIFSLGCFFSVGGN